MAVDRNSMDTSGTANHSKDTSMQQDYATPNDVEEGLSARRDPQAQETEKLDLDDTTPGKDDANDEKETSKCRGAAGRQLSLDHALKYSAGGVDERQQRRQPPVGKYSDDDFSANPAPTIDDSSSSAHGGGGLRLRGGLSSFSRSLRRVLLGGGEASVAGNKQSKSENTFAVLAGLCLSFNSGYINGCCMSGLLNPDGDGLRQAVSAFTGTYTRSALVLAAGEVSYFGFEFSMILCFIAGAFISGLINPKAVPYQLGPTYGPTFLVGSAFLIVASVLASLNPDGRSLFYFAAAANGIQNGMSSMYSGNLIRTTHLTGTSTDMGLILGQMVRGNRVNSWKFWVLLGLATSFWLGSLISFYATMAFRGFSLLVNAVFFFLIGTGCITFVVLTNHVTVWQAVSGTWQWKKALGRLATSLSTADGHGPRISKEFLLDLFDRIDADGSGTIEETELYEALKASGMHVTKKGVKAMIKAADDDDDGVISKEEWRQLVMG